MEKLIDIMNERIDKIESLLSKEIASIEAELKELRTLYGEIVKLVSRLSCIEERCHFHNAMNEKLCREIDELKNRFTELHTRLSPVEDFLRSLRDIRNRVLGVILANVILGAFGLYFFISNVLDKLLGK